MFVLYRLIEWRIERFLLHSSKVYWISYTLIEDSGFVSSPGQRCAKWNQTLQKASMEGSLQSFFVHPNWMTVRAAISNSYSDWLLFKKSYNGKLPSQLESNLTKKPSWMSSTKFHPFVLIGLKMAAIGNSWFWSTVFKSILLRNF